MLLGICSYLQLWYLYSASVPGRTFIEYPAFGNACPLQAIGAHSHGTFFKLFKMENWTPGQRQDFEDLSRLVNQRQEDYKKCGDVLKREVMKYSRRSTYTKIILITLGALVATKGIVDQLMVDYKSNKLINNLVLICFTLIGLAISIIAGFETAFKYTENAAGLRIVSAEVQANIRKGLTNQAFNFHTKDFNEAMNALKITISDLNDKLTEIYAKATSFGLDLASETN